MIKFTFHWAMTLLLMTSTISAQNSLNSKSRLIIIKCGDSLIYAHIYTGERRSNPIPDRNYYWYSSDKIHNNIGGYSGNLLIGDYVVLNQEKNMIEKGSFNYGLKTGNWKRWYPDGKLQSNTNLEDGLLSGKSISYSQDGSYFTHTEYKNGFKNGTEVFDYNDSIVRFRYKKGMMVKKTVKNKQLVAEEDTLRDTMRIKNN
jgi:antitoxin component YwqK of YwqJK toxin-antitoxin module